MMRRQMANRVGGARVARDEEGLAAAAAEVLAAVRAGFARLLHPVGTAECRKGRRRLPDIVESMLAYVPEFEARNDLRRMAGQCLARRRDIERTATPAAHAGLRKTRIIIRQH